MNRLSSLIVRRPPSAPAAYAAPRGAAQAAETPPVMSEDLRLFATSFLGGLAFFGTYLA